MNNLLARLNMTGYVKLRRLYRDETRVFLSASHEFGLWIFTAHGFGLHFQIVGPFRFRTARNA